METKSFFRLALVIDSNNAETANINIARLIKLSLYENKSIEMKSSDIVQYIKEHFGLEFSDHEIEKVITSDRSKEITFNTYNNTYRLTEKEVKKLEIAENKTSIDNCIDRFMSVYQEFGFTKEEIIEIISNYIYEAFNNNKELLLKLVSKNSSEYDHKTVINKYDNKQRELINTFLNWDDLQKNRYVYLLISYCFEYCMLTVKRDKDSFRGIFKDKIFYFDANIIFRIMGINNEERKEVTKNFVQICHKAGIRIRYTNFTRKEIDEAIKNHVNLIRELLIQLKVDFPLTPEALDVALPDYRKSDFYNAYYKWCQNPKNNPKNFSGFGDYLQSLCSEVIKDFEMETIQNYRTSDKREVFEKYLSDIRTYKPKSVEVCKTDVNNWMYIDEKRKKTNGSNFWDITDYIISSDSKYINWSKDIYPGAVPFVVYPSVWHSLILKYFGRADDDYKAFTLFLNLRYTHENEDNHAEEILQVISEIPEGPEVKDRILMNVKQYLRTENTEFKVTELVENSYKSIISEEKELIKIQSEKEKDDVFRKWAMEKADGIIDRRIKIKSRINLFLRISAGLLGIGIIGILVLCIFNSKINKIIFTIGLTIFGCCDLLSLAYFLISWATKLPEKYEGLTSEITKQSIFNEEYAKLKTNDK